jgi:oligopeptide transport system substrate-binding protein
VRRIVCAALSLLSMMSLGACDNRPPPAGSVSTGDRTEPRVLRLGNGAEIDSLDPSVAALAESGMILRDVYEGLTRLDGELNAIPGVAERWETSSDGRTLTFYLRPNARWSNGEAVTSEDFRASWIRVADPKTGSRMAKFLEPVVNATKIVRGEAAPQTLGVAAPDARTLVVSLEYPTAHFPQLTAHWTLLPTYRGLAPGPAGETVSNGAFTLIDVVPGSTTVARRNPTYWNAGAVQLDEVRYFQIAGADAELLRFRAGDIDVAINVPPRAVSELQREFGPQLRVTPLLGLYYYGFTSDRPPFNSRELREILSMVVDRERIVGDVMPLGQPVAYTWVPPGFPGYTPQPPEWASWPLDRRVAAARERYARAGYGGKKPLRFELRYNSGAAHERIALAVAAMWKEALGAEARPVAEEMGSLLTSIEQGQAPVFRLNWVADYPDPYAFLQVMVSSNGMNMTRFADETFDQMVRDAQVLPDPTARLAMLERAEQRVTEAQVVIPLYGIVARALVSPRVEGWNDNALRIRYSQDVRLVTGETNGSEREAPRPGPRG